MDPDHPAIRDVLREDGRATVPLDGWMTVLMGGRSHPLVPLVDVPLTMAGISSTNVMNAMQAASAALAVGLPERAVVRGLRSFVLDPERNPGRSNLFSLDGRIVLIDYAHNAAGMDGLIEICDGLRRPTADVWLAICTAGDRSDDILHDFAYRAARGADHLVVAELLPYLRGRDRQDIIDKLREGAFDGGVDSIDVYADELAALRAMLGRSLRGDVIAVTALAMRREVFTWIEQNGGRRLSPAAVKRIVTAGRTPGSTSKRTRRTRDRETVRAGGPKATSVR
jgi:cyanophycin synthetase